MNTNRPPFEPKAITLTSEDILLRPLTLDDAEAFYHAGNYPKLWQWVSPNQCQSLATAKRWIRQSLELEKLGEHVPFVIIDKHSKNIIGTTRYCSIRRANRNIEIGFTFITPSFQRTHVNTQAKYTLLKHAFESLGAIRVEFRTHDQNQVSRKAIARIGATFEGVLRNLRILEDGSLRNTAMFSVTEQEWPEVKLSLEQKMANRHANAQA